MKPYALTRIVTIVRLRILKYYIGILVIITNAVLFIIFCYILDIIYYYAYSAYCTGTYINIHRRDAISCTLYYDIYIYMCVYYA